MIELIKIMLMVFDEATKLVCSPTISYRFKSVTALFYIKMKRKKALNKINVVTMLSKNKKIM